MPSFFDLQRYAATGIASPDMTAFDKMRALAAFGGSTVQTLTGIPPLTFKADGKPLISWSILGNGSQTGTPSPDNIIMPDFCGVRTWNLFDSAVYELVRVSASAQRKGTNLGVLPQGTYTFNAVSATSATPIYRTIKNGSTYTFEAISALPYTFTTDGVSEQIIRTSGTVGDSWADVGYSNIMLNSGSTALPYEPYGLAEKITCAGQTVPVYLGQTQTVRRIKKLVLTGEETWWTSGTYTGAVYAYHSQFPGIKPRTPIFCTHLVDASESPYVQGTCKNDSDSVGMWIFDTATSPTSFKSYLAAQYAAGTPVTIWYVIAELETGIVNEPLAKIGDYADELTTIQVHGLSSPLYGIGDYKDTLNLSTGVVTRKVKKLVLTGEEKWIIYKGNYYSSVIDSMTINYSRLFCTHFIDDGTNGIRIESGSSKLKVASAAVSDFATDLASFKAFLAAQYAAGTPVVIWYVISTPETETVTVPTGMTGEIEGYLTQISTPTPTNRSVPKWNGVEETGGTYAVTVYDLPEIPTTTGKNTLTVETEKIHGLTNPLCGIGNYKDVLNLSTGIITRKIKKLVLDGTENWIYRSGEPQNVYFLEFAGLVIVSNSGLCTHYPNQDSGSFSTFADKHVLNRLAGDNSRSFIAIRDSSFSLLSDFQSYLAAQYANGTPVTVWYVLSTPETETITVPYGLECSVEGYLTQSDTPTPSSPITPDSNGILGSDGTYAVEVSLAPSNLTVKGHIK